MISGIKIELTNVIRELFNERLIYDEEVPEINETPFFLIMLTNQVCSKQINNRYKNILSFDIAYSSDKTSTELKADCFQIQDVLFREFTKIGSYRVSNKKATITENVLHFTFDITVFVMKKEETVKMQESELKTKN